MTLENMKLGVSIQEEIEQLEKMINKAKNTGAEWIEFNYGNGSNRAVVCNDEKTIEAISKLIIESNTNKINSLIHKFASL